MSAFADLKSAVRNPRVRRAVGYVLAAAILLSLGNVLYRTWGDLAKADFHFEFNLLRLSISLALSVLGRAFAVEAWRRILISLGDRLRFTFAMRVWFVSNLARYVPGNVWQVATMMAMVEQAGVSKTDAVLSQVIYTALALAIAGLLGLSFLLFRPDLLNGALSPQVAASAPWVVAIVFGVLVGVFALPQFNRLIVWGTGKVMRRTIVAPTPTFARGTLPPLFSLAMWLTNGLAFWLFVSSVVDLPLGQLPAFIAMNAGAYWIGYMSFITPSGLGFREGALAWMLATFLPAPVAVALSLATRLWATAGELLGVVLIWGAAAAPAKERQADARDEQGDAKIAQPGAEQPEP